MQSRNPVKLILLLILLSVNSVCFANNFVPKAVVNVLNKHKLPKSSLSLYIKEIGQPDPIVAYQTRKSRNPASVMKLVTTLAGLELLGPAYHWETEFYYNGILSNGVLQGDLNIKGGGDPFYTRENFWHSLFSLQAKGLKHIKGNLIIDNTLYEPESGHPGQFDNKPYRAYNVFPDAALLNFTAQQFIFLPQPNKVKVYADPPSSNLEIRNKLQLTNGSCRGIAHAVRMKVKHLGLKTIAEFTGQYPSSCGNRELLRSVTENSAFTLGVFKSLWQTMGGSINGTVKHGIVGQNANVIHVHHSKPLREIIQYINKFSNNVMARQLLLTIAKELHGEPGSKKTATLAVESWLQKKGIVDKQFVIENGSGLSRTARINALSLGILLEQAYQSPLRPEFLSSLPIAGIDGTMKKRFNGKIPAGKMRMKTGLLNDVRSMAGYVTTRRGKEYIVVSLQNHPGVQNWTGTEVQNALLQWLYDNH